MKSARLVSAVVSGFLLFGLSAIPHVASAQNGPGLRQEMVAGLQDTRRALEKIAAEIIIDDAMSRPNMSVRETIAGTHYFACDGPTVRLERRFPETSRSGLKYNVVQGFVRHQGTLYDFARAVETPEARYTSQVTQRDIPFPNPRQVVEFEGVEYAEVLQKATAVKSSLAGAGTAVAEGDFEGKKFRYVMRKADGVWLLAELSMQFDSHNKLSKYYMNVTVRRWAKQPDGHYLPDSARIWSGNENNGNQSPGRSYVVNRWYDLNESILPQTRITEGSLIIDEGSDRYLFGPNGELNPVIGPDPPKTNSWALLYLLSGTGLVLSLGFFVVRWFRRAN